MKFIFNKTMYHNARLSGFNPLSAFILATNFFAFIFLSLVIGVGVQYLVEAVL